MPTKYETHWWHGSSGIILWGGIPAEGPERLVKHINEEKRLRNPKVESDSEIQLTIQLLL